MFIIDGGDVMLLFVFLIDYSGKIVVKDEVCCFDLLVFVEIMVIVDDVNFFCLFWFGNMLCGYSIFSWCYIGILKW